MAKTKYAPLPEVVAGDLVVEIYPCCQSRWNGTAEQLKAEGLIPKDLKWPVAFQSLQWSTADGFDSRLMRTRPDGAKGPRRDFNEVDNWCLWRTRSTDAGRGWQEAAIYEKRMALQHALWQDSVEGRKTYNLAYKACIDKPFQSFKRRALGMAA